MIPQLKMHFLENLWRLFTFYHMSIFKHNNISSVDGFKTLRLRLYAENEKVAPDILRKCIFLSDLI